jgi:hypothetical protein
VAFGAVFLNKRLHRGGERAFEFLLAWVGNQRVGGLPKQGQQQSERPKEPWGA